MTTKHRAISVASVGFANKGVAATSLEEIARQLGVTKQTVLYHFGSKEGLVSAVFAESARALTAELQSASGQSEPGWPSIQTMVRASFSLALQRPELLGLLREVSRMGSPWSSEVLEIFQPLIDEAINYLDKGMDAGVFKRSDSKLVLFTTYAAITAVVSDTEALRALGLGLDTRVAVRLRSTVLSFLEAALSPETPE